MGASITSALVVCASRNPRRAALVLKRWGVLCGQAGFSVFIFILLSSQDGFSTKWHTDAEGIKHAPALYNGAFSTIAFLVGAVTSIISGWLGMTIATYANARTALEARKGIAPAFMTGVHRHPFLPFLLAQRWLQTLEVAFQSLYHRA